jgi:hypothetical protein
MYADSHTCGYVSALMLMSGTRWRRCADAPQKHAQQSGSPQSGEVRHNYSPFGAANVLLLRTGSMPVSLSVQQENLTRCQRHCRV